MYNVNDTICAVSSAPVSPGAFGKSIVRISGDETFALLGEVFDGDISIDKPGVTAGEIIVEGCIVDAVVYSFFAPASYTGDDLAEIHLFAAGEIIVQLLGVLVDRSRLAGPGEFTLRAYLNGKIDLSQAEAVAEIIASSNSLQLEAAEKLLAGNLCDSIAEIRSEMMNLMSLIEAGMDFAEEDIEFVTKDQAVKMVATIKEKLENILAGSIHYEEMIDLPAVALAGLPNAGKSSLLNSLLGSDRSIISDQQGTTRDVLSGLLELDNTSAMLFDCAGLSTETEQSDILAELSQQAAVEAIRTAELTVLCVDISKDDFGQDFEISKQINMDRCIPVATKCDLVSDEQIKEKLAGLGELLDAEFIATSTEEKTGLDNLKICIEKKIIDSRSSSVETDERIAINQRHHNIVTNAIKAVTDAGNEILAGNDELVAMFLRAGYDELAGLEKEDVDEAILDMIFSSFCIGK